MASASGQICVLLLDDKYLGKEGVVSNIEDAILIDVVKNGRFTESKPTAKKYGINILEFKDIDFESIVPPYAEQYGYPQDYSGYYMGLSYDTIRELSWSGQVLRDALNSSSEEVVDNNEINL